VQSTSPRVLLVNPWIHDFAAYDYWAKPYGLLWIAAWLRRCGFEVDYLDCLNRFHPHGPQSDPGARFGRGPYLKKRLPTPAILDDIPRTYSRYGIDPAWLYADLKDLARPDAILLTCLMTYWYPGLLETIDLIRRVFPDTPLALGGIYPRLWPQHAARLPGIDQVLPGCAPQEIIEAIGDLSGFRPDLGFDPWQLDDYPWPAFDLQSSINYLPLLTSLGCPYRCDYCAASFLNPRWQVRSPASVLAEIAYWHQRFRVRDFVFYDDALLTNAEEHIIPILEGVLHRRWQLRFHTPNALHIRGLSPAVAALLHRSGFQTLRLGLETAAFDQDTRHDRKLTKQEFDKAVRTLRRVGFADRHLGAYLLAGLPGQSRRELADSIRTVRASGIIPIIAHFTPIPHTALWPQAVAASRYDLEADPLFSNNAIWPCQKEPFSWRQMAWLKGQINGEAD
jgi:radical SAM superfamily enzyme YgiQ (UPF0313 family)